MMVSEVDSVKLRATGRGWALLFSVLTASAAALTGVWLYASPYVLLQQFKKAVEAGDVAGLTRWAEESAVQSAAARLAVLAHGPGSQFEAGYESFDRFAVRIVRADAAGPVSLVLRRRGLTWRLSRIDGLPDEAPPPVPAPASLFGSLLASAGMPPAQFVAIPAVRQKLEALLGAELPVFTADLAEAARVEVQGTQISVSGCGASGCKLAGAAMSLDTANGDASAAILKDGALTIYSQKTQVLEQLPGTMQTWLDRLAAQDNGAIPFSFHDYRSGL